MKLKPCPFCSGEARWANDDENWIECSYCGVETRYFDDTQEAIEAWNRREPIDNIITKLESHFMAEENHINMGVYLDVINIVKSEVQNG